MDSNNNTIDILIQCNELYPHSSGGIGMQTLNMANALHTAGHRVTILGIYNSVKKHQHPFQFIQLRRIKKLGFLGHLINIFRLQFFLWKYIVIQKNKIDIIEYPDYEGYGCFTFVNSPSVIRMNHPGFYIHGKYGTNEKFNLVESLRWFLIRRSINKADKVIAVANYLVPVIKRLSAPKKIEVIYNMTELGTEKNVTSIEQEQVSCKGYLLNFGTMASHKGIPLLIEAFIEIADQLSYDLLLAGRIADDDIFIKASNFTSTKNKNKIVFLGEQRPGVLQPIIQKAKAVIFPSLQENMPLAWAEAMGMGKVLWVSDLPVATEMITNGLDGIIFEKKNIIAIENALLQIENIETAQLKKLSQNAQNKYQRSFSTKVLQAKNIACFKSVSQKHK